MSVINVPSTAEINGVNVPLVLEMDTDDLEAGPQGPQGPAGTNGTNGTNGVGVPSGGTTGQVLKKQSNTNYDTVWGNASGGNNVWCDITDYGAVGDGTTDCKSAFDSAVSAAISAGHRTVFVPSGTFRFASAPATITNCVHIVGVNKSYSVLKRDYNGNFLTFTGANGFNGGMENIAIVAASGTSTGTAITIQPGNTSSSPDFSKWKHVLVTGWGGTFYYGLVVDGRTRVSPNPIGVRDLVMDYITIFECTSGAAKFDTLISANINGLQTYVGSSGNASVYIGYENVSSTYYSNSIILTNAIITGTLDVQRTERMIASGYFYSLSLASTVNKAYFSGVKYNTPSNSATNSSINLT